MTSTILGVAGIGLGTAVAAYGTRGFYLVLTVWAAIAGFLLGTELVSQLLGDVLFGTLLGITAGIGLAIVFSVVASLVSAIAVLILAVSVGYGIGSGLLVALGLEPGVLTAAGGAVTGAALGIGAVVADAPRLLIAALTAWGGVAIALVGGLVLVGWLEPAAIRGVGPVGVLRGWPLAMGAWLVGGGLAFAFQWLETARLADERLDGAGA
jgi:hypothetical protein